MNLTPKKYLKRKKINLLAAAYCAATGDFLCVTASAIV
jgi:hypothetical protein